MDLTPTGTAEPTERIVGTRADYYRTHSNAYVKRESNISVSAQSVNIYLLQFMLSIFVSFFFKF